MFYVDKITKEVSFMSLHIKVITKNEKMYDFFEVIKIIYGANYFTIFWHAKDNKTEVQLFNVNEVISLHSYEY